MCRWAGVSRSGYYAWRRRGLSEQEKRRDELAVLIRYFFDQSHQTYGYRRIHAILVRNGIEAGSELVRKIMLQEGLVACQPRPRARTTIPAQDAAVRPDLVQRDFTAHAPGHKWVGDITYIPTWQGHAYLATVMDCYSRRIIGYAIASHMRTSLITQALDMATRNCPPEPGHTILHSDKGSQYTSEEYAQAMAQHGIRPSLGRTGSCYDNAAAESFNAALKKELVNRKIYPTRDKAIKDVTHWIETCYNQTGLHSTLGYKTPNEVHNEWCNNQTAA